MATFLNDLRYAIRQLRKTPGFTTVCILTLALGVGANTAVFSVMNAVLLKSLPGADPDRIVYLNTSGAPHKGNNTGDWNTSFSYPVYDTLRQQKTALSQVMAYVPLAVGKVAVRYGNTPEEAEGDMVSGNYFSGLGVKLARGNGFTPEDESRHASIAVISYSYWTRRFARNPDILGQTLFVKGVPFTIAGVTAEGFEGTDPGDSIDFWIPMQTRPELTPWGNVYKENSYMERPNWWFLRLLGRLAPGVSKSQAIAQLQPVFQRAAYIGIGSPETGEKPPVLSFQDAKSFPGYEEDYGKPLKTLMAMVGLVLLIALSNVAMLLMARNATRQREFSLRLALGAGRKELFRQLLTESLLLVSVGGALAWFFAQAASHSLAAWSQIETSFAPDKTVLLFTLGVLVSAALVFGLAPLRVALASGPGLALKTSSATSNADAGKSRTGRIIVALQMSLCLVLLVGGGLLLRTLRNLQNIPLGIRTEGLLVFGVNPQSVPTVAEKVLFYHQLTDKLRVLPGVESVTLMEERIGSGWSNNDSMLVDGHKPPNSDGDQGTVRNNVVGPDFFHTLGVPVLAGREFTAMDTANAPHVAVINELLAKRFLPNQNPLGHTIGGKEPKDQFTIVGVVKDHKYRSIDEAPIPMAWVMYEQIPELGEMHFELRVRGEPLAILPDVRKAVQQMDPNLPLLKPMTQQAQYEETISRQLMFARLAGFFGLLAVVLVATGLYGTLAYRVNNRTVEIGVRMAVGAQRRQVVWMVLRDSLFLTAAGIVVGIPLAILVARALTSALYGVAPYDALSFTGAALGVAIVALAASMLPARRAASVDPLTALRAE
ncbi:ABC transporter permease [Alloacidobacterium sp.]|uniref:ABC transporter permease n=1 Tax=Alloacidobacterium sp. TaxID=2951999 RepID=UPI002D52BBBB|nr:ABC transporter permease [Alloacidobacterium sp.]HYK38142.1 ABC transporter permease [Alloacidobacterium sp.]